ncbi:MAG: hypothetical protein ACHBN1_08335 [Heteroscytonema crispum UTEX LB 1556]
MADLPRARSDPGGIFLTADFAPLYHQQPTTRSRFTSTRRETRPQYALHQQPTTNNAIALHQY